MVICIRDELINLPKYTKNIIMNLEDNHGNGSHWVCIYNGVYLQNGVYQTFQVQELNCKCCGQLCLHEIFQLNKKKKIYDVIFNLI